MTISSSRLRTMEPLQHARTDVLDIAYHESGPVDGDPVVLLHGFPYDIHSYVEVAPLLAAEGYRVIVPFFRGYGTTRFLSAREVTFREAGDRSADDHPRRRG